MSTPAIAFLKETGIEFESVRYRHLEKGARFAARATGFDPALTVKTLVVDLGRGRFALALMPGDMKLSEKKLARALGVKRLAMARPADAERVTGYLTGGISPFGIRRSLPVVLEKRLARADSIMLNGGRRGLMVKLSPRDVIRLLGCRLADICAVKAPSKSSLQAPR